jgi:hypothetical protein
MPTLEISLEQYGFWQKIKNARPLCLVRRFFLSEF